jgi:YebC/PmpR family DNA-binding regulatory protein
MAGHSKWKQIKHKKALADSKRAKQFTKIIKEISIAARRGGGDPQGNPRLRFLLEKSKEINMPQENAIRAIKKGTGELPGSHYESYEYEGYGPGGIAVIIEVLTDNKNKAIAELRHAFSRNGGSLADAGAVNWMFEKSGVILAHKNHITEDQLLEELLSYDIKEISKEDDIYSIVTDAGCMEEVKNSLTVKGFSIKECELEWIPKNVIALQGEPEQKALDFLQALEELEDVQNLYTNLA